MGQEYSKGENEMKIKLKRNTSTGLAVRTTLKAGWDYVPCGCSSVKDAGWWCDDGKKVGNEIMVWSIGDAQSWTDKYCPPGPEFKFPEIKLPNGGSPNSRNPGNH